MVVVADVVVKVAATRANELQKPWVLDPVGVGATRFRTEKCIELIHLKPTVIRGNASEIMAVVGASTGPTKVRPFQASVLCVLFIYLRISNLCFERDFQGSLLNIPFTIVNMLSALW